MRKVSVFVLAALLLAGAASVATAQSGVIVPEGKYPQTIEISIPKSADPSPNWPAGESISNNSLTRAMMDRLNVKVNMRGKWTPAST